MNRVLWSMYIFGEFLFRVPTRAPWDKRGNQAKKHSFFVAVFFNRTLIAWGG